ncbi:hypothetical protein ACI79G_24130 [Geodermatophilus sp. SYSU D00779]
MSADDSSQHVGVRRPGGRCVHAWRRPASTRPVLGIHGPSSTSRLWSWTLAAAPDVDLVAADVFLTDTAADALRRLSVPTQLRTPSGAPAPGRGRPTPTTRWPRWWHRRTDW